MRQVTLPRRTLAIIGPGTPMRRKRLANSLSM
jgi:hypothetical protein